MIGSHLGGCCCCALPLVRNTKLAKGGRHLALQLCHLAQDESRALEDASSVPKRHRSTTRRPRDFNDSSPNAQK